MKKNKKYLSLYYKWMKAGRLPQVSKFYTGGLCGAGLYDDPLFALFVPYGEATNWGLHYWAYTGGEGEIDHTKINEYAIEFTPFRQNVILLMAAVNNEL